ncbi:hypothetical protein ABIS04_08615 [Shewanella sp. H8]|uniref:hypothetical protein n=1 Tax=Shewanella sp. H8 TaxID=3342676 RepID=UPI003315F811
MDPISVRKEFEQNGTQWIFRTGLGQYGKARAVALLCHFFAADDEDEQIDDELRSCYNCQYRRWTMTSFECVALNKGLIK